MAKQRRIDFDALERATELDRHRRIEAQARARVNQSIDWSVCLVPGCGEELIAWPDLQRAQRGDSSTDLPLCHLHAAVVWHRAIGMSTTDPQLRQAVAEVQGRQFQVAEEQQAARLAQSAARTDGHIYFVRLNHLIKVGWTSNLHERLKSYGASVEVLVYYPGTRDNETSLHRQLRPALARGREWYIDGAVVHRFVTDALAAHGKPDIKVFWTKPKRVVAGKRHR